MSSLWVDVGRWAWRSTCHTMFYNKGNIYNKKRILIIYFVINEIFFFFNYHQNNPEFNSNIAFQNDINSPPRWQRSRSKFKNFEINGRFDSSIIVPANFNLIKRWQRLNGIAGCFKVIPSRFIWYRRFLFNVRDRCYCDWLRYYI